jgi:hypothetical protein
MLCNDLAMSLQCSPLPRNAGNTMGAAAPSAHIPAAPHGSSPAAPNPCGQPREQSFQALVRLFNTALLVHDVTRNAIIPQAAQLEQEAHRVSVYAGIAEVAVVAIAVPVESMTDAAQFKVHDRQRRETVDASCLVVCELPLCQSSRSVPRRRCALFGLFVYHLTAWLHGSSPAFPC